MSDKKCVYEEETYNECNCCCNDDYVEENNDVDYYEEDELCQRGKPIVVVVECGSECKCLRGRFYGWYWRCHRNKVLRLQNKCGKILYINFDKIVYWSMCED